MLNKKIPEKLENISYCYIWHAFLNISSNTNVKSMKTTPCFVQTDSLQYSNVKISLISVGMCSVLSNSIALPV